MIIEVKTLKITCDLCKKIEIYQADQIFGRPKGWGSGDKHYFYRGHYRTDDLCPDCLREYVEKK
jgi:hypothetical protein